MSDLCLKVAEVVGVAIFLKEGTTRLVFSNKKARLRMSSNSNGNKAFLRLDTLFNNKVIIVSGSLSLFFYTYCPVNTIT